MKAIKLPSVFFLIFKRNNSKSMSHRRYNPLLDEWVLVAANRVNRPWQGAKETKAVAGPSSTAEETLNPLAPGGTRPNGVVTPQYTETYVFQNDFPSLTDTRSSVEESAEETDKDGLFKMQKASGTCRCEI